MRTSIITSLFVASTQLQSVLAICKKNGNNLERCFNKPELTGAASSFCSSFVAAPTPVVAGFDCVTKKNGDLYATASVVSMCSCVLPTVTPPAPVSTTTVTSVSVSIVTVTESATECAASSTTTSAEPAAPTLAIITVLPYLDTIDNGGCSIESGPARRSIPRSIPITSVNLQEAACYSFGAETIRISAFYPGTYCEGDATPAGCTFTYFDAAYCNGAATDMALTPSGVCLAVPGMKSATFHCGCDYD